MRGLVSLSGGKNSVRACFAYIEKGIEFDTVTYIPYFKDDIPLIPIEHYNFLLYLFSILKNYGVHCYIVRGVTYYDWCSRVLTKGKNKGKCQSFPLFIKGKCGFARDSKIKACQDFFNKNATKYDFIDIGLCSDEFDRKKLKGQERSILQEMGIKDIDCFYWCRKNSLLSPKYNTGMRDGCVLCPHAGVGERISFYQDFPCVVDDIKHLQRLAKERNIYPLRGKHFFIENQEFRCGELDCLSLFDEMYY